MDCKYNVAGGIYAKVLSILFHLLSLWEDFKNCVCVYVQDRVSFRINLIQNLYAGLIGIKPIT